MAKRVRLDKLGTIGLVTDIDPETLPPQAVTRGQNYRCDDGYLTPQKGHITYYDPSATGTPHYLVPLQDASDYHWFYPLDTTGNGVANKIYSYDGSTATDRTRVSGGDYTGTLWNGCILHGCAILNNGTDSPQGLSFADGDTDFADLIYSGTDTWADQSYTARVVRSHKNFLFALNITDSSTFLPTVVHWSAPALPGYLPTDWDYTDTTVSSDRVSLSETNGQIIDGLSLHDDFIVYKQDSVYSFGFTGNPTEYFSNRMIFNDRAIFAQDCVADIGGRHFVLGTNTAYIHDGNTYQDILQGRNAELLFSDIDPDNWELTFVVHHGDKNEVWICYPETGQSTCSHALIYNYVTQTWFERDLPSLRYACIGKANTTASVQTWADLATSLPGDAHWDDWEGKWAENTITQTDSSLIGAGTEIWQLDFGSTFDGSTPDVLIEHVGLDLGGPDDWHMVVSCYPRASGSDSFKLQLGKQYTVDGPVTWSTERTITPGTTRKIPFRLNAPLHAWRVTGAGNWRLYALDLHVEATGYR